MTAHNAQSTASAPTRRPGRAIDPCPSFGRPSFRPGQWPSPREGGPSNQELISLRSTTRQLYRAGRRLQDPGNAGPRLTGCSPPAHRGRVGLMRTTASAHRISYMPETIATPAGNGTFLRLRLLRPPREVPVMSGNTADMSAGNAWQRSQKRYRPRSLSPEYA